MKISILKKCFLSFFIDYSLSDFLLFSQLNYPPHYPIPTNLQVSLDWKKRNVITFYIDSLDDNLYQVVDRVNKTKDFEDFVAFNKFMSLGFGSNNNILYLSGGFSKTINYMFLYKNKYSDHIKYIKS